MLVKKHIIKNFIPVLCLSFLVILFSGVSLAIAADDNDVQELCQASQVNCDNNQAACTLNHAYYGFDWTSSGYPGNSGNPSCCGDDSKEYYTSCYAPNPGATCDSSTVCCDSGNYSGGRFDCVYGNTCYNIGQTRDTGDSSDDAEVCLLTNSSASSWVDPDMGIEDQGTGLHSCIDFGFDWFSSASQCDNAGPGGICDDADGGGFCCGDDDYEYSYHRQSMGQGNDAPPFSSSPSDKACCRVSSGAVYNGSCYYPTVSGTFPDTFIKHTIGGQEVFVWGIIGIEGSWAFMEPDFTGDPAYPAASSGIGQDICENPIAGFNYDWVPSGEANVGEYNFEGREECCGDDDGEYYKSGICCNSNSDINSSGHCCPSDKVWNGSTCAAPNEDPYTPSNPSPANNASCINPAVNVPLSWTGGDPNSGDSVAYAVYACCGGASCPLQWQALVLNTNYTLNNSSLDMTYGDTCRWQIYASDFNGGSSQSSIWSFTTRACNPPPGGDPCCESDGCSIKSNNSQPTGYTDADNSRCDGTNTCSDSCNIQDLDYYCNGTDTSMHQRYVDTGTTCAKCVTWVSGSSCPSCSDGTNCGGVAPAECCSGVCDNNGTSGISYYSECSSGPSCVGSGNWGYSPANEGQACDSAIDYCKTASVCDTWQQYKSCQSGACTTPYVDQSNISGTECSGQSCTLATDA